MQHLLKSLSLKFILMLISSIVSGMFTESDVGSSWQTVDRKLIQGEGSGTMETVMQENTSIDISAWADLVEQQREERFDFRTTGSLFPLGDEGLNPVSKSVQIWTVDVSTTGALLRTLVPIDHDCSRILLKLVMPQLNESYIEGSIVRCKQDLAKSMNGTETESHLYGVQFTRLMQKDEVLEELLSTLPDLAKRETSGEKKEQSTPTTQFLNTVEEICQAEESRLPVLSAIGLAVVYAALLFVF